MNRRTESEMEAIFREAIKKAVTEITESDAIELSCWWPPDYAERMAVQLTQSVGLMEESQEEALAKVEVASLDCSGSLEARTIHVSRSGSGASHET